MSFKVLISIDLMKCQSLSETNIESLFNDESRTIRFKNYKLVKTFTINGLYDLIFLIKLNKDYTIDSVYLHYGNSNKIYLNI